MTSHHRWGKCRCCSCCWDGYCWSNSYHELSTARFSKKFPVWEGSGVPMSLKIKSKIVHVSPVTPKEKTAQNIQHWQAQQAMYIHHFKNWKKITGHRLLFMSGHMPTPLLGMHLVFFKKYLVFYLHTCNWVQRCNTKYNAIIITIWCGRIKNNLNSPNLHLLLAITTIKTMNHLQNCINTV